MKLQYYQEGTNNDHITYAFQLKDVLSPSKIESLSQGTFCGYVADTYKQKIHPKVFCGEVKMQAPPKHSARIPQIADVTREELEQEVDLNYQKIRADIQNLLFKELNDPA